MGVVACINALDAASLKNLTPLRKEKECRSFVFVKYMSADNIVCDKDYITRGLAKAPLWVEFAKVVDVPGVW